MLPAPSAKLPLTVIVPIELPGARTPPLFTVVEPTVPVPPSVAPPLTVTGPAIAPFTLNVPALTVVAPV